MGGVSSALIAVVAGILTVAIVAVIVARNSSAPAAISAGGQVLSSVIKAAVTPIAASNVTTPTAGNLASSALTQANSVSTIASSFFTG